MKAANTPTEAVYVHRAYVQSRVIDANLTHLADILAKTGPGFDDELASFTLRFERLVRRLKYAVGADEPRMPESEQVRDEPTAPEQAVGI